jgi:trimethylamine--corrinoid protein Co-methyltransferase
LEQLDEDQMENILDAAFEILATIGMVFQSSNAVQILVAAGGREVNDGRLLLSRELCEHHLAQAPTRFTLHARDSRFDVPIGGDHLLVSPGYGSAFVADENGCRRNATMDDFRRFATLAYHADIVDITGGLLVAPCDVPPERRPVELTKALLECSAKPLFGSVAGGDGARQSLDTVRAAMPNLDQKSAVMGLVNINSPLRLDTPMAEALLVYAQAGQPVLLTPGILMGITAPVTVAGAMAQAFAELIGCVVLTQLARAGTPVVIGLGGFGSDLRDAGCGFGRPEQALSTIVGAQLSRRLELPYRGSPGATGAFRTDARAGWESMMTAFAAWNSGVHVCLQAAGILDHINAMSYEKFIMDVEVWEYIKRISIEVRVDKERLALETIAALPDSYMMAEHTVRHFRTELHTPTLAPAISYEAWLDAGSPEVSMSAREQLAKMETDGQLPRL